MTKRPSLADSMRKLEQPAPPPPALVVVDAAEEAKRGYYAATRVGLKKVTTGLDPEEHRQFKMLVAERTSTLEGLLREAISDLFVKYGKPPLAKG
ncbi:ribbon-helix-helix domain-containing protein [Nitrospirillum amazonense]|nr:ribbon-helix-helix domain-containing protein [Nitrospirillum amazonense]